MRHFRTAADEACANAATQPERFWEHAARDITWTRECDRVLDDTRAPFYRWFAGGHLNTCYNALDRHVLAGRGADTALIYDSPVTDTKRRFTYGQLLEQVAMFAGVLRDHGVQRGDRVLIYMPMVPQAVIAMLGCARIGAVHSVVFGGFAPHELATRIDDAQPRIIVSASCGIEPSRLVPYKPMLDEAIRLARFKPETCIILNRPQATAELTAGMDIDWYAALTAATPQDCVDIEATDPLYVLYTSGTTGVPKGVVRDNGGHAVALRWSMENIYGVGPREVFWAASDIGWVVGHSYIVYGPLLAGCTTVLYEGKPVGTPDPAAYWRVVAEYGVNILFTAPTALRAIRREDPDGTGMLSHDLSTLRALFVAGERCDPDTMDWAAQRLGVPVIDHWWQTETGWPIASNCLGLGAWPIKPGSPSKPVPGYRVENLDELGLPTPPDRIGNIVIKLPLPPGCLPTLWHNDAGFADAYLRRYRGYYLTGDAGYFDEDGYLYIMSRTDDIINVAGHRLSTGGIEEALLMHPSVAECAVVGVEDALKGEVPIGFVVLQAGTRSSPADIERELVDLVRERIGPVAAFKRAIIAARLPKTRSGKILRGTIKRIAEGRPYDTPATIEDPEALADISRAVHTNQPVATS